MITLERPCCTVVVHEPHTITLPTPHAGLWRARCPGWAWADGTPPTADA